MPWITRVLWCQETPNVSWGNSLSLQLTRIVRNCSTAPCCSCNRHYIKQCWSIQGCCSSRLKLIFTKAGQNARGNLCLATGKYRNIVGVFVGVSNGATLLVRSKKVYIMQIWHRQWRFIHESAGFFPCRISYHNLNLTCRPFLCSLHLRRSRKTKWCGIRNYATPTFYEFIIRNCATLFKTNDCYTSTFYWHVIYPLHSPSAFVLACTDVSPKLTCV